GGRRPVHVPGGPPASSITWTPDSTGVLFASQPTPHGNGGGAAGAGGARGIQIVTVADSAIKPLPNAGGTFPVYSPSGKDVAFMGGGSVSVSINGGPAKNVGQAIDRGLARVLWMPDGKSLLVGANDSAPLSLSLQPIPR